MAKKSSEVIEEGDVFFFYRPRVGVEEVEGREDVQRFYMVLAPQAPKGKKRYRLFVLGRKKLPEVRPGEEHPEERNWALNVLTTSDPEALRRDLAAFEYATETRGERRVGAAKPVGEGKYALVRRNAHTELAYVLELPEKPGPVQEEFDIRSEASYVAAVKNPDVTLPGAPAPKEKPHFPEQLQQLFGERRWIAIEDPELLDYENAELLLIGARAANVEEELGVEIDAERETERSAEILRDLRLRARDVPREPLFEGEFPAEEMREGEPTVRLSKEEAPGRGGKAGGRAAAQRAPSAAAVAKLLAGIQFPRTKDDIVAYAREHQDRVKNPSAVLAVLRELPEREYASMADVQRGFGTVR